MRHYVTVAFTRDLKRPVDLAPRDSRLCEHRRCPRPATTIAFSRLDNTPHGHWLTNILCDEHPAEWRAANATTLMMNPDLLDP
jgi:hypothetical protein